MNRRPVTAFAQLGGLCFLPRTLDKIRIHARGELHPDHHEFLGKGFDGRLCHFLGIRYEDLRERVLAGGTDEEVLAWIAARGRPLADADRLIWNGFATKRGWQVGTKLQVVRIDGVVIDAEVRGLLSGDTSFANYVASREMFADAPTPIFDSFVYIKASNGAVLDDVQARIAAISSDAGIGTLQSKEEFIDDQAAQVNQILGLIYGLLGLSIIIAIVGIIITLLLSVFERRREIGLLRAVGMTRSQVRSTVRWESVITSLLGAVTGVVLGIVMGVVVVAALADSGDGIAFRLPVAGTIWIVVISFFLGVVAAIYPARRATKVNVVEAISTT